jgi:hypothetical protein
MWQRTEELARRHEQSSQLWLKLPHDGDRAVVVILGEPYPREVCFVDGRFIAFTEAMKNQGLKPSLRIAFNVAMYDSKEVRVLEQGVTFFKDLVQVRTKYGLDKWAFEIRRHGASKDLKTHYSILPERQLTAEEQKAFASLPLHDLERLYAEGDTPPVAAPAPPPEKKSNGNGDDATSRMAQEVVAQLKTLPREAVERFCRTFKVQRVKDLPPSKIEPALAFVRALGHEFSASSDSADTEVDPFA